MSTLIYENNVWMDKPKYDDAERLYYEKKSKAPLTPLADEVAKARQRLIEIKQGTFDQPSSGIIPILNDEAMAFLKAQQKNFDNLFKDIQSQLDKLSLRIGNIENQIKKPAPAPAPPSAKQPSKDDDDVDLFASESDEDDEAANKLRDERLAAYNAKKSKKPTLIAKSSIILDIKPWDDETDMGVMEKEVRKIEMPGLLWGASKLVPLAYGIHKLQINCVVEDELVSIDALQEQIQELEDYVQSVDIAAFNKI